MQKEIVKKICIIKIIEMENIFTSLIFKGAKEIWGPIIEDPHTHTYIYIYTTYKNTAVVTSDGDINNCCL